MGINTIKCKGVYTETGKTGFGERVIGASDFDGNDILKSAALLAAIAAGSFAAGCLEAPDRPPPAKDEIIYNRDAGPEAIGKVIAEGKTWGYHVNGYKIEAPRDVFQDDQAVVLQRINDTSNVSYKDIIAGDSLSNVGRVIGVAPTMLPDIKRYLIETSTDTPTDDIKVGDSVAIYKAIEVLK